MEVDWVLMMNDELGDTIRLKVVVKRIHSPMASLAKLGNGIPSSRLDKWAVEPIDNDCFSVASYVYIDSKSCMCFTSEPT